jgi:uncharacterized protein DUF4845
MKNQKIQGKRAQRGASVPLVLVFVAMSALVLLVGFKLYPAYFEHWQIQSVVESFATDPETPNLSPVEMRKRFKIRMQTNNVRDVKYEDAIEIIKEDGIITIYVDYESRVNIYKNVDAVVVFKEETEIFL